jgi:Lon protease-like protein
LSITIPLFPLSRALFPDGMLHLQIFEPRYLDLIKRCWREQAPFGVVGLSKGREVQTPGDEPQFFSMGCLAHIRSYTEVQPALLSIVCQGGLRFELNQSRPGPYGVWQGQVTHLPADPEVPVPPELQHMADRIGRVIARAQAQKVIDRLPIFAPYALDQCGWVANRYAEAMPIELVQQVELLREADPLLRLKQVAALAQA